MKFFKIWIYKLMFERLEAKYLIENKIIKKLD